MTVQANHLCVSGFCVYVQPPDSISQTELASLGPAVAAPVLKRLYHNCCRDGSTAHEAAAELPIYIPVLLTRTCTNLVSAEQPTASVGTAEPYEELRSNSEEPSHLSQEQELFARRR